MAPDSEPTPRVPWLPVNEGEQQPTPATDAAANAESLTPTKPTMPAWIQREQTPEPIEADEAEVLSPVATPSAEELLPSPADGPADVTEEAVATTAAMPRLWSTDPVQLLGESAVASAALSAAGAPTPLGGVPIVPVEGAVTPPSFGNDAPQFTPVFADAEPAPEPTNMQRADALAAGIVAHEQADLASKGADLDAGVAYAPQSFGDGGAEPTRRVHAADAAPIEPPVAAPIAAPIAAPAIVDPWSETVTPLVSDEPATEPAEPTPPSGSKKRRWWLWVVLALLVIAGVAVAVAMLNRPEPTVVPGVVVTQPPPGPTITPIAAPTATAFQAAMPTTVGHYSLVQATPLVPADVALTAGRVADGVDLAYRSGEDTMNVRALQYYSEADATQMFTKFVGEGAATQPVDAGGATVGESAIVTSPKPGIVWRNGTTVFILTGPALQLTDFYAQFGL